MLNEVALGEAADGLLTAPVKFNGQDFDFALDTTAEISLVSPAVAEKVNVSARNYPPGKWVSDASNHQLLKGVESKFEMGKQKFDKWGMALSPYLSGAGVLGRDFVEDGDLDIDFGAQRLRTYSSYHCPGNGVYWQAPVVAKVALTPDVWSDSNFHVRVDLDGRSLFATLDTGAVHSSIRNEIAAKLFQLAPDENMHRFAKFSIGDFTIADPVLEVSPGRNSVQEHGFQDVNPIPTRFRKPDLVIGMDLLRQMHFYLAFEEGKLYVSSASQTTRGAATPPTTPQ